MDHLLLDTRGGIMTDETNFRGHRILIVQEHASALKILAAAGLPIPIIPDGCNTVESSFTCAGGARALVINQTGFQRELRDNEQEVNGCSILVLGETLGRSDLDDALLQAFKSEIEKSM